MTRRHAIQRRDKLAARLSRLAEVLRGSLLERTVHHSSGCTKCARGEGHPLWVLNVNYPGAKTRQLSLRPEQVPQVRKALDRYRQVKETLEAISELNQQLLRMDRDESRHKESEAWLCGTFERAARAISSTRSLTLRLRSRSLAPPSPAIS
jgi:hypothetical protein